MIDLGIFGTSGYAREVADIAVAVGYRVIFIARNEQEEGDWPFDDDIILERDIGRHPRMHFAVGVGDNVVRKRIAELYAGNFEFPSLIHPSASFGRNQYEIASTRRGVIVCAGVRFTNNIEIGSFSIFNLNSTVGHDCEIGEYVNLAPGVSVSGNVRIQEGCWIGTGAVINQGTNDKKLSIGARTVIGSGAVVTHDCEPDAVYVGVPARRIK